MIKIKFYVSLKCFLMYKKKNRLSQKGVLRRFSITCYGKQGTLADMRNEKTEMFKALKNKRNSKEYEEWFLRYEPGEKNKQEKRKKTKKRKKREKSRKSKKLYKSNSDYKLKPY